MYAPHMELLYMHTRKPGGLSSDKWIVDRATWAQFCATCEHLRAFDWSVAPYATSFFRIFGQHVKPQLTELTLAAVPSWAWYTYYQGVGEHEAAAVRSAGVGAEARDIHHVLRVCPALTKLKVDLHSPRIPVEDYGGRVTVVRIGGNNEDPRVRASKNTINQELFGDEFIDELCTSCPLVGEIALALTDPLGGLFTKTSEPITTFTDRALIRLATLRFLFVLVLKAVNVTGKGLFELINSAANEVPGQRDFDLRIGDDQGPCEMGFYRALDEFLTCLQRNTKPLRFQDKKLVLHVRNAKTGDEPTKWSETYLARLRKTLKVVRAKYPTLQFRIEMSGLTTKSFQRIAGFGVFTRTAMPYHEYEWTDLQHGALVEGALLRQELMGREDEYEEEDEENDSYEDESDYYDESDESDYDEENDHPDYNTGRTQYSNGLQSDDEFDDDESD